MMSSQSCRPSLSWLITLLINPHVKQRGTRLLTRSRCHVFTGLINDSAGRGSKSGSPTPPPPGEGRNGMADRTCLLWFPVASWRVQSHSWPRPDKRPLGPSQFCSGNQFPISLGFFANQNAISRSACPAEGNGGGKTRTPGWSAWGFSEGWLAERKKIGCGNPRRT